MKHPAMKSESETETDSAFVKNAIDAAIKICMIGALLVLSYRIVQPFVLPVIWAIIIAVALEPMIAKFAALLGGRRKLASILFTLLAVAALVIPVCLLADSSLDAVQGLVGDLKKNELHIPPAPENVAEVPVVGKKISEIWNMASTDIKGALAATAPLAENAAKSLVSSITGGLAGLLQFVISFIIAGVLLVNPGKGFLITKKIATSVAGVRGEEYTRLAIGTIRGVMTGVIGVAVIQSVLATIGMVIIGVPAAGVWGVLILICAIVQLPPILILGPIAAWVFTGHETMPSVLFLVWALAVSASDGILKPVLMARGLDTPMLVILLGAIGGMMMSGIIGLFLGAVIFSITYTLFMAWVNEQNEEALEAGETAEPNGVESSGAEA